MLCFRCLVPFGVLRLEELEVRVPLVSDHLMSTRVRTVQLSKACPSSGSKLAAHELRQLSTASSGLWNPWRISQGGGGGGGGGGASRAAHLATREAPDRDNHLDGSPLGLPRIPMVLAKKPSALAIRRLRLGC